MRGTTLSRSLSFLLALAPLAAGCDDPPKAGGSASASASGAASAAPTPAADPTDRPKPTTMPELVVDEDGPYLGGSRVKLADPTGPEKLLKIVKDLPVNGKPVTLLVDK